MPEKPVKQRTPGEFLPAAQPSVADQKGRSTGPGHLFTVAEQSRRARRRIANARIDEALLDHFEGDIDLSPDRVKLGLALLDKYVPSVKAVEARVTHTNGPDRAQIEGELQAQGIDVQALLGGHAAQVIPGTGAGVSDDDSPGRDADAQPEEKSE